MINSIKPIISNIPSTFAPFINKDGVNFAIIKPLTKKQEQEKKEEKEKRSNALGYSIALASVLTGFGVLALVGGLPKGARLKVDKLFKYLDVKVSKLKENKHMTNFQKFNVEALEKLKALTGQTKGIFNVGSIKDVTLRASINKVPVLRRFGDYVTKLFETISVKTSKNSYSKTILRLDDSCAIFSNAASKLSGEKFAQVDKHIQNIQKTSSDVFTAKPRLQRLNEVKSNLKGLHEKVRDRIFKVKEFVTDKETYTTFIPEELASESKMKLQNTVYPSRDKIISEVDKILKIYKEALPEKEFLKIQKHANKAIKSLNKSVNIETDKLFDKLRDLEIGSAPTEVLSVLTSAGIIGWGLTKADNKDERISVTLKYGIPALGAVATSLYCTVGLVSGGAALVFGLLSGLGINKIGEAVDKSRKKYNEGSLALPLLGSNKPSINSASIDSKKQV